MCTRAQIILKSNNLVFDHVAKVIGKQIDSIAERLTQLGGVANGTTRQAAMVSNIPEYPVETIAGMDHVRALADSLGHYCKEVRDASGKIDDIGDEPTSDFFNQLIVDAEEQLYFLESHLEAGDVQWLGWQVKGALGHPFNGVEQPYFGPHTNVAVAPVTASQRNDC
jgi:bacterioferritin (cytochrome b1)